MPAFFLSRRMHDNDDMAKRECGSCTACCEGWLESDELNMRPGRACQHCTQAGCAIYDQRPEDPCIRFICGWLQDGSPLPDHLRPDRAGVIVLFDRPWHNWDVIRAIPTGPKVPAASLEWLKTHAQEVRLPLLFQEHGVKDGAFTDLKHTGFGPPAFVEEVKYSIGPEDIVKF
jgi:hypothetical protein